MTGQNGARRVQRGAIGARSTRSAARKQNDVLAARRSLAVVVSVRVNRRGEGGAATERNVRMTSVGVRRCGQNGARCARRHDRCALDKVGGADKERRARGSARARRRRGGSGEPARRWNSSNEAAGREDDVGRRPAVRPGGRTRRATTRSARVDEVGGAIKERRARGSALARRRRVGSCEPARGAMEEQQRS